MNILLPRLKKYIVFCAFALFSVFVLSGKIFAAPASYLNYQGRLENSTGNLLTGNYYIAFCIYNSTSAVACTPGSTPTVGAMTSAGSSAGTLGGALWGEVQYFSNTNSPSNEVENGVFNANLGEYSSLNASIFENGSAFYLGVNVYNGSSWDGQMSPLEQIDQVAYAMDSATVNGLSASSPTGPNQIVATDSSGNIDLSASAPGINSEGTNPLTFNGNGATGNIQFYNNTNYINTVGDLNISGSGTFGGNVLLSNTSSDNLSSNTSLNITSGGSVTSANVGTVGVWNSSTALPQTIRNATSVEYNGYVYEIGGNNNVVILSTVYYAPINSNGTIGAWNTTTALPQTIESATSVEYNGYVYEIGGSNNSSALSTVYYALVNSNGTLGTWTSTSSLPVVNDCATSVEYNGYIYEIGGSGNCYIPYTSVYYSQINSNGTIGNWILSDNTLPNTLDVSVSVVYNGYIYEIGGGETGGYSVDTVYYSQIGSNGNPGPWELSVNPLPLGGIRAASGVEYNGYIYLLGGCNGGCGEVNTVFYSHIGVNGNPGVWNSTTSLPQNIVIATSVEYNGYVYEIGGSNEGVILSTVYYAPINNSSIYLTGSGSGGNIKIRNSSGVNVANIDNSGNINSNGNISLGGTVSAFGSGVNGFDGSILLSNTNSDQLNGNSNMYISSGESLSSSSLGSIGTWNSTTSAPLSLYSAMSFTYGGYIYLLGGQPNQTSFSSAVYYASLNSDGTVGTWTATTSLPQPVNSTQAVAYNGYVYLVGGQNGSGSDYNVVYYAPINSNGTLGTWSTGPNLPQSIGDNSTVIYNGYIYELGGQPGGGTTNIVYYAQIQSNGDLSSWYTTTSLPGSEAVTGGAVSYRGYIYLIGCSNLCYAKVNSDGSLGSWNSTASNIAVGGAPVISEYDDYMYLYNDSGASYYAKINSDGSVGSWSTGTTLPDSIWNTAGGEYNGYMYVLTGSDSSGQVNSVYYSQLSNAVTYLNSSGGSNVAIRNGQGTTVANVDNSGNISTSGSALLGGNISAYGSGTNNINGNTVLTTADLNISGLSTPNTPSLVASNTGGSLNYSSSGYYYEIYGVDSSGDSFPSSSVNVTLPTVSTPSGVSASVGTSGTVGANLVASTTYYYEVTAVTPNGQTTASTEVSGTEGTTAYPITISWSTVSGATSYYIYKGTVSGTDYYLANTTSTSYTDSGSTATTTTLPPTANTAYTNTNEVTITWQSVLNATSYTLDRSVSSTFSTSYEISGLTGTSYVDTGSSGTYIGQAITSSIVSQSNSSGSLNLSNNLNIGGDLFANRINSGSSYQIQGYNVLSDYGNIQNIFVGYQSGNAESSGGGGSANTGIGNQALYSNTTGSYNSAFGSNSLGMDSTGAENSALGSSALSSITTGEYNTAIGYQAGDSSVSGNANVSGSDDTFIGYNAGPGSSTQLNNAAAIGSYSVVSENNALILGGIDGSNGDTSITLVGIGTATPAAELEISGITSQTQNYLDITSYGGTSGNIFNIDVNGDVSISGHIVPTGTSPASPTISTNAGTGATSTLGTGSTDDGGVVNLTTGTASWVSGVQLTITFVKAYSSTPVVQITPLNAVTAAAVSSREVYVTETTTGFSINFGIADTASNSYSWNYQVIQ